MVIERKLVIALITSSEFIRKVRAEIDPDLLQDAVARLLAEWTLDYFDEFRKAPHADMEQIYYQKIKTVRIDPDLAEEIEEDILPGLSAEYERKELDIAPLLQQTTTYMKQRRLEVLHEQIAISLERNDTEEAERLVENYKGSKHIDDEVIIAKNCEQTIAEEIRQAFSAKYETLIRYPGAAGELWNNQLTRGSFVAFLASEKRGKSVLLWDMARRGLIQGMKIAFFQAGDMSRNQQFRRIAIDLTQMSDKEKNVGKQYIPIRDCILNQIGECDKPERECVVGAFFGETKEWIQQEVTKTDIIEAMQDNPQYKPCRNCKEWDNGLGAVWFKEEIKEQITEEKAIEVVTKFFDKYEGEFRMSTYPNDMLTVRKMKEVLYAWDMRDGFVPDIILVDYADILAPDSKGEFRHAQNQIWKSLRGLNQEFNCLLVTATQADANSYDVHTLKLKNFSEDKRKYAHVTAFYGLNQDPKGREKGLKILRVNELMLREDDYDSNRHVILLQNLSFYRAVAGSFWAPLFKKKEE